MLNASFDRAALDPFTPFALSGQDRLSAPKSRVVVISRCLPAQVESACNALERFARSDDGHTLLFWIESPTPVPPDELWIDGGPGASADLVRSVASRALHVMAHQRQQARLLFAAFHPAQVNDVVEPLLPATVIAPRPDIASETDVTPWQDIAMCIRHLRCPVTVA